MRFWWVNQNQTYKHEFAGGYLWSPKRNRNGRVNPFYECMREVAPGDVVFSFCDTWVKAAGIAASYGYSAPKPLEFGTVGAYWEQIGWRVDVAFREFINPIRPADHMAVLAPLLPAKYSPLQPSGKGLQSVYLTSVPEPLAMALANLIGPEARALVSGAGVKEPPVVGQEAGLVQWEAHQVEVVTADTAIEATTKAAIIQARRGQGLFRQRVMQVERRCRITGVDVPAHLRASHCKPWRDATNDERLNGENGLLLTPDADHLFDRGFISFDDNGDLLVSPVAHVESLVRMGVDPSAISNVGVFSSGQKSFLGFHRENVFLRSRLSA